MMKALMAFLQKSLAKELERAALQNDKQRTVGVIYLITFTTGLTGGSVMYSYDMNSSLSLFTLGLVSILGWLLNRANHVNRAAVLLMVSLLIVIQFNIYTGFGIHDVTIIAWPAFIFFAGLLFGSRTIPYVTALIMLLVVVTGLIPNAQFISAYSDTGDMIVMLLILLAFSIIVRLILRRNEHSIQRLQQSEERFQAIYHSINDAIVIQDAQTGAILDINEKMLEMFGYTRSEALQFDNVLPISSGIPPYTHENALEWIRKAATLGAQRFEWRAKDKSGCLFWVDINMKLATIGNQTQVLVSIRDITARKRAELQQEVLYQVLRVASSQLDADRVAHSAVETIVGLTGYPHVCIALPDEDGAHWVVRGAAGSLAAELGATYLIDQGVIGHAFKTGQVQWVRDILDDPNYVRDVSAADAPALRSEFVAPMRRGDRLIGALNVESDRVDAFDEADARMIHSLADIISLALENARLYGEAQQEISERKQAEVAQRESHHLLEGTFASLRDAVFIIDANTTMITDCNPAATEIFGYSREDMLGRTTEFLHVDRTTLDAFREHLRSAVAEKGFLFLPEFKMKRRDAAVFPTEHTVLPLEDEQSKRIGWVSVVRDITERKHAEQALRENEEKYRRLFDNASLGIFQSSPAGQVISINPAFARMMGYGSAEDALKNIQNVATDLFVDPNRRAEIIRLLANNPDLRTFENVYRRKDGSTFIGQLNVTPVRDADGRLVRTEGMIEDITERKQAEAKIRAALEEKETLLREVHHRVKNNLQAMIALMEMQTDLIADEATRQFLKELEGQARTMALVYEQLYQSVNLARVQMAPYLQQLTYYISDTFGAQRMLQLNLNVAPIELDVAQAMPCGLMVNELFTNIFKHAFPPDFQGQPIAQIALQLDGETYRLTVADNGVGLPPGLDWQASQSLGLHLVNLWATHQLGGTLAVSSDAGTIYTITFPNPQGVLREAARGSS
jgi:PAS domain S-box-containing protein